MSKITLKLFFISLFLINYNFTYSQNDCIDAVTICGNSNIDLDVNGIGTQELFASNICSSQENNSLWLQVTVVTNGTLAFTLTPGSTNINEDYDFFIFGPNISCCSLGQAIRFSNITNIQAVG